MLYRKTSLLGKDFGEHYVSLCSYLYLFEGHHFESLLLAGVERSLAEFFGPDLSRGFLESVEHACCHDHVLVIDFPDAVDVAPEQLDGALGGALKVEACADLIELCFGTENVLVLGVHVHPVACHHLFHHRICGSLLGVGVLLGHSGDVVAVRHHGIMLGAHPVEICPFFDVPVGFALMDLVFHKGALFACAVSGVLPCFGVPALALEPDLLRSKRPNTIRGFHPDLSQNTLHSLHTKVRAEILDNLLTHAVVHLPLRIAAVLYHTGIYGHRSVEPMDDLWE